MTLEQFRKNSIQDLKNSSSDLKLIIKRVLNREFELYIIGSVLDKKYFNENSDIDIGIFIWDNKLENGPNERLTERVRKELLKIPFEFGNVDVIVFNNQKPIGKEI